MRKALAVYPYDLKELNALLNDGWKVESTTNFYSYSQNANPSILVILVK